MKLLLAAALLALLPIAPAPIQAQKRPMTFEDLMAMKRVSDPQISTSGKWVMFSVTDVSLANNTKTNHLWTVPISGGQEKQVTFGDGEENGRFSPDAKQISYEAKGQLYLANWDDAAGKPGTAHALTALSTEASGAIWSPDSGRLLFVSSVYPECSPGGPLNKAGGWLEESACNKQKDAAAAASPVKAQLFTGLLYRHWNAYTGEKRSHILAVSANNGTDIRDLTPFSAVGYAETPTFSLGGPLGYAWAPDSHEIAYVTNLDKVPATSTNNDIFTLRLDDPAAKPIKVSTSPGSDDAPQYSPDGKYLAFRSQARAGYESDRFRLMLYNRGEKSLSEVRLSLETRSRPPEIVRAGSRPTAPPLAVTEAPLDRWVDEFLWSANSERIFFTASDHGQEVIYDTNFTGDDLHRYGRFSGGKTIGEWSSLVQAGPEDRRLVGVLMFADRPAEIAIANRAEMDEGSFVNTQSASARKMFFLRDNVPLATPNYLSHLNDPALASLNLSPLEPFYFQGDEGAKVQGFLVKPPNFDPSKKYPVKFLIHGGPQGAWGDAWSYRWNPELMAASGYVVVMINPRGSTGYGQAFIDGINGDWGGKAYTDLMNGLDYAEQHYPFLDKSRECALGASYGGFMANWILTHTNRFACIVTHDGMYNPAAAYGDTEELWFNQWEFRRHMPDGTLDPEPASPWRYASLPADQDPFRKWSPMAYIQNAKTPTLVIHSQRDYRLDVSEGLQLFTALQLENVPSEMLYFPDEGHWVQKPENSQLWNKTVADWCDKYTHTNAYATP